MKPYQSKYIFSNKIHDKAVSPLNIGYMDPNIKRAGMRVAIATVGHREKGNKICLSILVDEDDGIIADVKFQAFGGPVLVGLCDLFCDFIVRKNYDQAMRVTAELLEKRARDLPYEQAIEESDFPILNLLIEVCSNALEKCTDIPISDPSYSPPVPSFDKPFDEALLANWDSSTLDEKITLIKGIIKEEIQPYIELDAGGIEVLELKDGKEVVIAYQGACTTCPSSTGSTLNAIEQILKTKVHPSITVTPDASFLHF